MEKFKNRWDIEHNWQLFFPLLGILLNFYLAYRIVSAMLKEAHIAIIVVATVALFLLLLLFFMWCFKMLENKWIVESRWEMIRIFIVFAITGSTSALISKPIMALIGVTKENLNTFIYWFLYIIIGIIFYQILLVFLGWLFGQFKFFWEFEKKMLRRMGIKLFVD